jgi:hypothetical protein
MDELAIAEGADEGRWGETECGCVYRHGAIGGAVAAINIAPQLRERLHNASVY